MSPNVFNSVSISAISISAHQAQNAIQWHKQGILAKIKKLVDRPVNYIKRIRLILIILFFTGIIATYANHTIVSVLIILMTIMYGSITLFYFLILLMESFSCSKAKRELKKLDLINSKQEKKAIKDVINSSLMIHIIAFVSSLFLLAFLIGKLFIPSFLSSTLLLLVFIIRIIVMRL